MSITITAVPSKEIIKLECIIIIIRNRIRVVSGNLFVNHKNDIMVQQV